MSDMDVGLVEWAFKGIVGILFAVGGWMWTMLIKTVSKTKDDLAEHKLESAKVFVTKVDMMATVTQLNDTVKRIHDRLDDLFTLQRNDRK